MNHGFLASRFPVLIVFREGYNLRHDGETFFLAAHPEG